MLFRTAERIFRRTLPRFLSMSAAKPKQTFDKLQVEALNEKCYLVDSADKITGIASKRECHLVQKDGTIPLHRAFSVFLFNKRGDLLLQKRSDAKITYPACYSNACCSHPLADYAGEDEEKDALGVKRAAQRRLHYELGIPKTQMPLEQFQYLTRIHYYDLGDGQYGEHEIDYILFLVADVELHPNPNEVSEISFIPMVHMSAFEKELEGPLTPWFHLILKSRLRLWWHNLEDLQQFVDHDLIHKLKG